MDRAVSHGDSFRPQPQGPSEVITLAVEPLVLRSHQESVHATVVATTATLSRLLSSSVEELAAAIASSDAPAAAVTGDNLIGFGTTVVGDVRVGRGAVVDARSLVTQDLPGGWVYVGCPARPLRRRRLRPSRSHRPRPAGSRARVARTIRRSSSPPELGAFGQDHRAPRSTAASARRWSPRLGRSAWRPSTGPTPFVSRGPRSSASLRNANRPPARSRATSTS